MEAKSKEREDIQTREMTIKKQCIRTYVSGGEGDGRREGDVPERTNDSQKFRNASSVM